jgi:pimeloyl-ACP methyl ester carboxylesterase
MIRKTLRLSEPNLRVGYLEAGQGATLVLIHGVGMNADAWYPQLEALSRRYRVIALDMPGHGESEGFHQTPALEDYVHWAGAAIRSLVQGPCAVAGHSMGALIAAGLAIEYPQWISHAIVISGVFRRDPAARKAVLSRALELANGRGQTDAPLARWFSDAPREQVLRRQVGEWLHQVDRQGYARAYQAFADGDSTYAGRWGEIGCPVLVMTGEYDANSSPAMAHQMAQATPGARAVIVKNARHMLSLTDPQPVNDEILTFLGAPHQSGRAGQQHEGVTDGRG